MAARTGLALGIVALMTFKPDFVVGLFALGFRSSSGWRLRWRLSAVVLPQAMLPERRSATDERRSDAERGNAPRAPVKGATTMSPLLPSQGRPRSRTRTGAAKALGAWVVTSIAAGGATFAIASVAAPGLAADVNDLSAVIVFEVYALLIASLYTFLGRADGMRNLLRLRFTSAADLVLGVAVGLLSWGIVAVAYFGVGLMGYLSDVLLWIGSDAGRLGVLGPITGGMSLLRACLLASLAEELLFRGALFGLDPPARVGMASDPCQRGAVRGHRTSYR